MRSGGLFRKMDNKAIKNIAKPTQFPATIQPAMLCGEYRLIDPKELSGKYFPHPLQYLPAA
ncbi:MAG TPA: hypothetical protein VI260_21535 [Blastocatellia bacterium]